jgi:type IV pilus assembly protein PilO
MADNFLTRLPLAGQLAAALALSAGLGGAFYYLQYSDMLTAETDKTSQLARLQQEIRSLEVTASKLDEFQRDVASKEQKLETLKRILPADKETPELMKKVQYLAAQSNLAIKKFTPGATVKKSFQPGATPGAPGAQAAAPAPPPQPGRPAAPGQAEEFYQEWPINVEVDGNYHNLGLFFDRVSRLSRLVNVGEVKIKTPQKQTASNTISVSCVATTYVYVEAPQGGAAPGPAPASVR